MFLVRRPLSLPARLWPPALLSSPKRQKLFSESGPGWVPRTVLGTGWVPFGEEFPSAKYVSLGESITPRAHTRGPEDRDGASFADGECGCVSPAGYKREAERDGREAELSVAPTPPDSLCGAVPGSLARRWARCHFALCF